MLGSLPMWGTGGGSSWLSSARTVFAPMAREPLDLTFVQWRAQSMVMQSRILRKALERVGDVDAERVRFDGQPAVVEQTVYVAAQEKSPVLVMDAELRIAVGVASLQDTSRGLACERTPQMLLSRPRSTYTAGPSPLDRGSKQLMRLTSSKPSRDVS